MAIRPILNEGHPLLRQKAKKVRRIDPSMRRLVDDMFDTMHEADGLGLAAPQVGVPLRLIVIEHEGERYVLFNPEITRQRGTVADDEGCLSLPRWFGPVVRSEHVTVKGRDHTGKAVRLKLEGLLARAMQHEVDHLDGMLFVDRVEDRAQLRYVDPAQETGPQSPATHATGAADGVAGDQPPARASEQQESADDPDGTAPSDEPDQQAAAS